MSAGSPLGSHATLAEGAAVPEQAGGLCESAGNLEVVVGPSPALVNAQL